MDLQPIEFRESITREEFQKEYYLPQKPLIFRSFGENWPSMQNWTYERFKTLVGHEKVQVFGSWKTNQPTRIKMPPEQVMSFSDYIDLIQQGPNDFRLFLFNIFKYAPQLKQDFTFPDIADGWVKSVPVMFFGGEGSEVRLHYDIDLSNVFLTQFSGEKRVTLFSPEMSPFLYKQPMGSHSNVDLRNPDYNEFPALAKAEGFTAVLKHGDTVFMPSGWWHYNEYITTGFGMALRTVNSSILKQLKGAYNVFIMKKVDDLISTYYEEKWADWKKRMARQMAERAAS
ncbi:MAG TPA: cupin-like domain-containing protein [Cryomorphaceae bacterium]|nr:transcription factor [Owenweeksia sp.]MBF99616.1 transcription factor [Owenweeksia sp.]HAD96575.1 cupin-like domain-containing protein [Cryomorphaceae bacterium]|tara:strand:- start:414 stop:1268 length:855 start_codon:yes stop_codon:yes gene_type:complete